MKWFLKISVYLCKTTPYKSIRHALWTEFGFCDQFTIKLGVLIVIYIFNWPIILDRLKCIYTVTNFVFNWLYCIIHFNQKWKKMHWKYEFSVFCKHSIVCDSTRTVLLCYKLFTQIDFHWNRHLNIYIYMLKRAHDFRYVCALPRY